MREIFFIFLSRPKKRKKEVPLTGLENLQNRFNRPTSHFNVNTKHFLIFVILILKEKYIMSLLKKLVDVIERNDNVDARKNIIRLNKEIKEFKEKVMS
jgi:hypothetical protein